MAFMTGKTLLTAMTSVGAALAGQQAQTLAGSLTWGVEQDSSGGGTLTMTYTPADGSGPQDRVWRLTPVGGLPLAPEIETLPGQVEQPGGQPTNANTSESGTATTGTLVDVGLGIKIALPI
jgi:hypothetical protein